MPACSERESERRETTGYEPFERERERESSQHKVGKKWPTPSKNVVSSRFRVQSVMKSGLVGTPDLGGVPREQKMRKGHLPRVTYHQVY